jgi:muramoyltetrapeptide carboxypeptidase
VIVPPALRPGDRVRVIAPSGPFDRTLVLRGLGWLSERYDVKFGTSLFDRDGYLAGPDTRRLSELNDALRDPETRAIVATRGGYGLTRIAHAIDTEALRRHPKWLVGFSDVTALHIEAQRADVASLHAHNIAGLGRGDAHTRASWVDALERPGAPRRYGGLAVIRTGLAEGPVVGGNLTVLFTCAAIGRLRFPPGAVLLLEDVGEAPYRVDRMLTALLVSGALDAIAAVLVGSFTDAPPGRYGVPIEHVLRERLGALAVPVLFGLPVGHTARNEPVHLGLRVRVDGRAKTVDFGGTPTD